MLVLIRSKFPLKLVFEKLHSPQIWQQGFAYHIASISVGFLFNLIHIIIRLFVIGGHRQGTDTNTFTLLETFQGFPASGRILSEQMLC